MNPTLISSLIQGLGILSKPSGGLSGSANIATGTIETATTTDTGFGGQVSLPGGNQFIA